MFEATIPATREAEAVPNGGSFERTSIMEPATRRTSNRRWSLAPAVTAVVIAALAGGMSIAPAQAQENDWNRGREVHRRHVDHERWRDRDRDQYQLYSYSRPAYVYSPPPVYYAPPPGPPVIDFVFPLRFR
jgi:hypothetical protein